MFLILNEKKMQNIRKLKICILEEFRLIFDITSENRRFYTIKKTKKSVLAKKHAGFQGNCTHSNNK